jgi:Skp family chaperone for outer membrane proteins
MKAASAMWLGAALSLVLAAGPSLAQTPPTQQTPPQTPPAAKPAQPAPPPAQPAPPPRPFPEGAKVAYVNIQAVAANSAQGRAFSVKIQELQKKKNDELGEKNKALTAAQQKLQQGATVMSDDARATLEKDIDRMTRELQFLTQNAQAEVQELQTELQADFQKSLEPIIERVATAKGLQLVFSVADSGLVWADRGLDVTLEVIKEFDVAAVKPKAPQAPSPK